MPKYTSPQFILEDILYRFWSKVDIKEKDKCWNWTAALNNQGYGFFWYKEKMCLSHRMAWALTKGDIIDNGLVLHKCDNPKCVNPEHLYIGTASDNMKDRSDRNPYISNGERRHLRKLGGQDIDKIICLRASGMNQRDTAKIMEVSQWNIWNILKSLGL